MDISTALWAAAIGAGASLATIALFGAVAGRRFRTRMHARRRGGGFGGPPWAYAGAGHRHAHGGCRKHGDAHEATSTDADAPASAQAEA
jgi:hypothetical protein